MVVQLDFLHNIPYFSSLSTAELELVKKLIVERTADRGEMLLLEGETSGATYFVVSGAVKMFKTSAEGKEQILSIVRPGESFNDVPVFNDEPSPVSLQAMGPVVFYEIRKKNLSDIVRRYPRVALDVIKVMANRVRQLMSLVEDLSFKHVIGRVAKILLENAGDGTGPGHRLTQQDMAAMAGTAREMIGRSLKTMEDSGAIKLDRHRIIVSDKEALRSIAGASF